MSKNLYKETLSKKRQRFAELVTPPESVDDYGLSKLEKHSVNKAQAQVHQEENNELVEEKNDLDELPAYQAHLYRKVHNDLELINYYLRENSKSNVRIAEAKETMRDVLNELREARFRNIDNSQANEKDFIDDIGLMHSYEVELERTKYENNIDLLNTKYQVFRDDVMRKLK